MAPASSMPRVSSSTTAGSLTWRPTKIMNMRDLSKDDDFLSHLLVEKLGTGTVPLLVHKMDSSRRLPKTDAGDLLQIVRRLVATKGPVQHATRQAVDELLLLPPIRYYLKSYTQKQINAFATHASRYFELYHPSGSIEIAHTSRYSHRTGKSELCILATRFLAPGAVITELKGSMANLTEEEDKELKRTDLRHCDIRRDFSVIHSKQMKKNHLFLGPARFVNHDCNNNCELFREGKYITFRVLRPIAIGEEITAHYGDGYFGRRNRHCLCETCEKKGRGGYAPDHNDEEEPVHSDSGSDGDSNTSSSDSESEPEKDTQPQTAVNINERRTRRGVYAIVQESDDDDSDDSDEEEATSLPLADVQDVPADDEIEMESSALTSLASSRSPSNPLIPSSSSRIASLMTPDPDPVSASTSASVLSSLSPAPSKSSFRSIISTRRQKALEAEAVSMSGTQQLVTPPVSEDAASLPDSLSSMSTRASRSASSLSQKTYAARRGKRKEIEGPSISLAKGKGKEREEVKVKKEESEARVLRVRQSALPVSSESATPDRAITPKGPDGKPLPICATCCNVLPVISVDSKVVWGLGLESSIRKKKKLDCPRCMRHFAIYGQAWPSRIPGHGSTSLPTPREEGTPVDAATRKVTHKVLPTLDRKLAAAAKSQDRETPKDKDERPKKRRKTDPGPRAEMTVKARRLLHASGRTRSGRQSIPSSRAKDVDATPPKRGRPRLNPVPKVEPKEDRALGDLKSIAAKSQPRESNGRFGKKSISARSSARKARLAAARSVGSTLSRAQRAVERGRVKSWLERKAEAGREREESESRRAARKRSSDDMEGVDHHSSKRVAREDERLPFSAGPSFLFGMGLCGKPNPMSFARRTWAPRISYSPDGESDKAQSNGSGDSDVPVTPEDEQSPPAITINEDSGQMETDLTFPRLPAIAPPIGAHTFKPSPFTFARRRWASTSATPEGTESREHSLSRVNSLKATVVVSDKVFNLVDDKRETVTDPDSISGNVLTGASSISSLSASPKAGSSLSKDNADTCDSEEEDAMATGTVGMLVLQHKSFAAIRPGDSATSTSDESSALSDDGTEVPADHIKRSFPLLPIPWPKDTVTASLYFQKSASFSTDPLATPPNLISPGWETPSLLRAGWDSDSDSD